MQCYLVSHQSNVVCHYHSARRNEMRRHGIYQHLWCTVMQCRLISCGGVVSLCVYVCACVMLSLSVPHVMSFTILHHWRRYKITLAPHCKCAVISLSHVMEWCVVTCCVVSSYRLIQHDLVWWRDRRYAASPCAVV